MIEDFEIFGKEEEESLKDNGKRRFCF